MKSSSALVLPFAAAALLAATSADAAVVVAKDCTQKERQFVNSLLEQDVNPFYSCATKARGDITVLSTSRLCPIAECKTWLEYMAENAPDCIYDDTNYGTTFTAKAKDCGSTVSSAGSGVAGEADTTTASSGSEATTTTTKSSSGSSSEAGATTKPVEDTANSSSGSGSLEIEPAVEVPILDDGSTVTIPQKTTTPAPTTRTPTVTQQQSAASSTSRAIGVLCAVSVTIAALAL
uniref:Elicitin-like protein n=1 Tax=Globisporangium ultimum (strain ATCC 200006 / CBS 805.95 / DAOM BR144) TaxID=431595 RepID=K3WPV3_GLOUD